MFDQEYTLNYKDEFGYDRTKITPYRYINNGTTATHCDGEIENTFGEILISGSVMRYQQSCKPNTGNAGNNYSFPGATAEGRLSSGNEPNSICARGWTLTANAAGDPRSYYNFFKNIYNIEVGRSNQLVKTLSLPMSFIYSGLYLSGSPSKRFGFGLYWSSGYGGNSRRLLLGEGYVDTSGSFNGYSSNENGLSLRCVKEARSFFPTFLL